MINVDRIFRLQYLGLNTMKKIALSLVAASLFVAVSAPVSAPVSAAEVCKVSMMGRVCYEEGSAEATAAHMKGDAVAETVAKKKEAEDAQAKKVASNAK